MHTCRTRYPISEIFTQFGELIFKMMRMPVRNSALHCVVRTFIHIDVDLLRAPTAAQKESLPEIEFCKSSPSRWHHLNSRSRVSRPFYFRVVTHGNISAPPDFQLYFKKSNCAQSRLSRKRDGHRTRVGRGLTIRRLRCPLHPRASPPSRSVSRHSAMRRSRHPASSTAAIDP